MGKGRLAAGLVIFCVAVAGLWGAIFALDLEPQLGLDLQGGVSITLIPAEGQGEIDTEVLDQTVTIIRQRIDALGVAEPDIARQGTTIQVQLPGAADREEAEDVIGRTAQLQFRRVLQVVQPGQPRYDRIGQPCDQPLEGPPPADEEVVLCASGTPETVEEGQEAAEIPPDQRLKYRLGPVAVAGEDVDDATAQLDPSGFGWETGLDLNSEGARQFAEVTGELACEPQGSPLRELAIVLDGVVEASPPIAAEVVCGQGIPGGQAVISASNEAEARELAIILRTGALPIELDFAQSQSVSPTLGSQALVGGLQAGFLGLALVGVYLILLYRGMGVAAIVELFMFGILTYGLIVVLGETVGFTLTLAGIAGVIVSIGIAADSSIIYRERYRDEIRSGRTVRTAADKAFTNAWQTSLTGNTVAFLAALVLYFLATGPVRGFAFTLGLSTVIDLLLFGTFTRSLFGLIARSPRLARSRFMGLRADTFSTQPTSGKLAR